VHCAKTTQRLNATLTTENTNKFAACWSVINTSGERLELTVARNITAANARASHNARWIHSYRFSEI
jgi:hypothetical protein